MVKFWIVCLKTYFSKIFKIYYKVKIFIRNYSFISLTCVYNPEYYIHMLNLFYAEMFPSSDILGYYDPYRFNSHFFLALVFERVLV